MKNYAKILVFSFTLFLLLGSLCYALAKEDLPLASDFELQDTRQDIISLSSYKDKQPVILFFWTTWCPFCQKELRVLNQMYAGFVKDGLELLVIDVGESPATVENFIESYYLTYRVLLDKDTAVAKAYGVLGVPTYVFINKEGKITFQDNFFSQEKYKELIPK